MILISQLKLKSRRLVTFGVNFRSDFFIEWIDVSFLNQQGVPIFKVVVKQAALFHHFLQSGTPCF